MKLKEILGLGQSQKTASRLTEAQAIRLAAWRDRVEPDMEASHRQTRYIVVDVEATGLDLVSHDLLAVGALALTEGGLIDMAHVYEAALAGVAPVPDELPARCVARLRKPVPPADALLGFLEFSGKAPLVAHRADFPRAMLARAMRRYLGLEYEPVWIDLAYILPGIFPGRLDAASSLNSWLAAAKVENYCPHNAVADALAVARLMQMVMARGGDQGMATPKGLQEAERVRKWVHRNG